MSHKSLEQQLELDRAHIWHPYSAMHGGAAVYHVAAGQGVYIELSDGRRLIDGMASWWCAIHGYNHPQLNDALQRQLDRVAHVMFGGLTHTPAIELVERLLRMTPPSLQRVFIADSGSVAVEVAMKMAIQYWQSRGRPGKQRMATLRNGYHGDTLGAMSVCDPVTGMHGLFASVVTPQFFVDRPGARFGEVGRAQDSAALAQILSSHGEQIAALILEPIVQGAGGMYFYSADFLKAARQLCDRYEVLLIADEIATGFGRSGELFACEHAAIEPDILCLGKALTGGYLSLAATLTTAEVSAGIDAGDPGVFMHGPTFMANPLACAVAAASIDLLEAMDWRTAVARIERGLERGLAPCRALPGVAEVRVLGAIGVVEMRRPVDMAGITAQFVAAGVWVRPFGKLVYLMPPYVISDEELDALCRALVDVVAAQPV